jgi:hypothetical protein
MEKVTMIDGDRDDITNAVLEDTYINIHICIHTYRRTYYIYLYTFSRGD